MIIRVIKRYTCLILLIISANFHMASAQGIRYGLPGITNYLRTEYKGGTQNWSLGQAPNGCMYFANNDGLLEFDGGHWAKYRDMELIYRSLCIDGNKIYVGAYNKFGYYEPDKSGELKFHSLIPLLKGRMNDFDEIWRIHKTSQGIVFQSFRAIFIFDGNRIDIVYPRSKFHFSYYVNGILWVYDEVQGLMQIRDGKVRQVPGGGFFSGTEIWSIMPLNDDQVLIGTAKRGVFRYDGEKIEPWNKPVNELLKKYQMFSGAKIRNEYFAFGTIQNGLILTDTSGKIILELNKERGILNNTVLCIGSDRQGDIWLGLDNGISIVHFNSPHTYIQNYFDIGSGYASALYKGKLYLGTNQGLFCIDWEKFIDPLKKKEDFHLIEGTEGQVWCLTKIGDDLLCGHNFGVFQISGEKAVKVSPISGGWSVLNVSNKKPLLLVGHYSGISVLEKKGTTWVYRNELKGFNQSSHYFAMDETGDLWISHGYKGIFRIHADSAWRSVTQSRFYGEKEGLPSAIGNNLFKIQSGIVVTTRQGIYRYNEKSGNFLPDDQFSRLLPNGKLYDYIIQDNDGNIWYYYDHQPGVLRIQEDGTLKNITAPFLELKGQVIPSYGHINPLDENNVIIGVEGGFAHYLAGKYMNYNMIPALHISELHSGDTSEGQYRYNSTMLNQDIIPEFRHDGNMITISFAASRYTESGINFQYKLDGFDSDWSPWTEQNKKEYTNLPAGEYKFRLKARTVSGVVTKELSYKFRILPPWYLTNLSLVIFMIIIAVIAMIVYRLVNRRVERSLQKQKLEEKNKFREREQVLKEDALIAEKEMIRLRNEALNMEMIHKEKELANSTMLIIQKNEILTKLKNDLNKIRNAIADEPMKNEIGSTIKRIGKEIDNEKQWQVFNTHVEQVHEALFKKLIEKYPDLTPRELSLCAYLRMNISSKEIATLMNISTRGVEISRYRIRKKLGLGRDENLTDFMLKL
ncbi:MAG TPA: triple tyrosine motif-containing protein [Bacteroidales bacterium]|nr:triple tyrosine motif-containing protein [Bacteroidales bacterium]